MTAHHASPFLGLPNATIILASVSVARQKVLQSAGIDFKSLPAAIDEAQVRAGAVADDMMPEDIAVLLAFLKGTSSVTTPCQCSVTFVHSLCYRC